MFIDGLIRFLEVDDLLSLIGERMTIIKIKIRFFYDFCEVEKETNSQ